MELLVELVMEIVGGLFLLAVAYTVGTVVFLLVRAARVSLARLSQAPAVLDGHGRAWEVRVALAPPPLRYRLSSWYFRMRPKDRAQRLGRGAASPDSVSRDELAHPSGLVERFEEVGGLVVWVLLALTLVAVVVLVLEAVLVIVLAGLVLLVRTVRGGWQCEVVTPDGQHLHVPAGSYGEARQESERLRAAIAAGTARLPGPAGSGADGVLR